MTKRDLLKMTPEDVVSGKTGLSMESIEYLFAPTVLIELLLRLDFPGVETQVVRLLQDGRRVLNTPDRALMLPAHEAFLREVLESERFYRELKRLKGSRERM